MLWLSPPATLQKLVNVAQFYQLLITIVQLLATTALVPTANFTHFWLCVLFTFNLLRKSKVLTDTSRYTSVPPL